MKSIPIPDPVEQEGRFFCPVENCPHRYATKVGYVTLEGYQRHYQKVHHQNVRVGFISRIDFGSPGYRKGLLDLAFETFAREKVSFIVLAGGLASFPYLKKLLPKGKNAAFEREALLKQWTDKLADAIPQLRDEKGRLVKIYITTSPGSSYDSWLGAEIAGRLAKHQQRQHDIRFWGEAEARFPLKGLNRDILVLLPTKAAWRSKYFSTPAERIIEDKQKQTALSLPDLWVVGCLASSLTRPAGEMERPYITVPALHRLEEVKTSENQVGVRVLEFAPGNSIISVRTYSYKDLVASERDGIPVPEEASKLQQRIITELKRQGPMTIGLLEDTLRVSRSKIQEALNALKGFQPSIDYDKASQLYNFSQSWIQNELRYTPPPSGELREDRLLCFGCLHAGAPFTEFEFVVETLPKLILEQETSVLIGAGDFIQGLKHDLANRGEVIAGFNYTQQETLAAYLVGSVILKVFRTRFEESLKHFQRRKPSADELTAITHTALLRFLYREGNHDAWVKPQGMTPLETFRSKLISYLARGLEETIHEHGLQLPSLRNIAEEHVVFGERHTLPSGLCLDIYHPNMARAQTSSLRTQHTLEKSDCPAAVIANFHVAINVEQWESELGQRIGLQVGTLVWKSEYEELKLKRLDVGVGFLRIQSHNGRIVMSEIVFAGPTPTGSEFTTDTILQLFLQKLGI